MHGFTASWGLHVHHLCFFNSSASQNITVKLFFFPSFLNKCWLILLRFLKNKYVLLFHCIFYGPIEFKFKARTTPQMLSLFIQVRPHLCLFWLRSWRCETKEDISHHIYVTLKEQDDCIIYIYIYTVLMVVISSTKHGPPTTIYSSKMSMMIREDHDRQLSWPCVVAHLQLWLGSILDIDLN